MTDDNRPVRIVRTPHSKERPYFSMARKTAQDLQLTYEALGLLTYLLSKPDGWETDVKDLAKRGTLYKAYKILRELRKAGYMSLEKEAGKGRYSRWVYQVFETCQLIEIQQVENQLVEFQLVENQQTYRIQSPKKEQRFKKEQKKDSGANAPRTRDLIFDAVALGHGMTEVNGAGGRIGKISNWLKGTYQGKGAEKVEFISSPATVEHINIFFADWKKDHKGIDPPLDFIKFVEHWRKWAGAKRNIYFQRNIASQTNEPTEPIDNPILFGGQSD